MKEKHVNFAEQKSNNECENLFLACYTLTICSLDVWFMDSGCNNHMIANLKTFIKINELVQTKVTMKDGRFVKHMKKGDVQIHLDGNKSIKRCIICPSFELQFVKCGSISKRRLFTCSFKLILCCLF